MKTCFHVYTPSKALFHSSCLPPFSPTFSAFSKLLGNLRPTELLFIRSDMRCIIFYLTRGRCPSRDIPVLRVLYFCIKVAVTRPSGDDFFSFLCAHAFYLLALFKPRFRVSIVLITISDSFLILIYSWLILFSLFSFG